MFLLARSVTLFLIRQVGVGRRRCMDLSPLCCFAFFVSAHFMSLILSYATLFTAREVEFLQAFPIAHTKLFVLRTGENIITSTGVLLLIGTAGVLGYGAVFQLAWYQYLMMMFLVMIPLVVIAGILGVFLLMMLILLASKIGVRWMLAAAIPVYSAVLFLSYRNHGPYVDRSRSRCERSWWISGCCRNLPLSATCFRTEWPRRLSMHHRWRPRRSIDFDCRTPLDAPPAGGGCCLHRFPLLTTPRGCWWENCGAITNACIVHGLPGSLISGDGGRAGRMPRRC